MKLWKPYVELQSGYKLTTLHMNNAAEFRKLAEVLKYEGVESEFTKEDIPITRFMHSLEVCQLEIEISVE